MARWITPKRRSEIVARDDSTCIYCGCHVVAGSTSDGGRPADDAAHLDHITPRSWYRARGRKINNKSTNLVTSCPFCNESRGDTPLGEYCRTIAARRLGEDTSTEALELLGAEIERTIRAQARRKAA